MVMELNTSPFAIYNFKVNNSGKIPIIFKYGESINIDVTLQFAPTLGGVMSVVYPLIHNLGLRDVDPSHTGFSVILKINYAYFYKDNKYIQPLYAYQAKLTEDKRYSGNIFEISQNCQIDSSLLPSGSDKRDRGYFLLDIDWTEKTGNFEGKIISLELPISEEGEQ